VQGTCSRLAHLTRTRQSAQRKRPTVHDTSGSYASYEVSSGGRLPHRLQGTWDKRSRWLLLVVGLPGLEPGTSSLSEIDG
jgi:hypothetical protein